MTPIRTFEQRNKIIEEVDNIDTVLEQSEKRDIIYGTTFEALEKYRDYLYNLVVIFDKVSLNK
jgi:hypothetical protein